MCFGLAEDMIQEAGRPLDGFFLLSVSGHKHSLPEHTSRVMDLCHSVLRGTNGAGGLVHPNAQGLWGKLIEDLLCFSSPESFSGYCKETALNSWLSRNVPCLGVNRLQCITSWSCVLWPFQSKEMNECNDP